MSDGEKQLINILEEIKKEILQKKKYHNTEL